MTRKLNKKAKEKGVVIIGPATVGYKNTVHVFIFQIFSIL